jgi:hypothetical protein
MSEPKMVIDAWGVERPETVRDRVAAKMASTPSCSATGEYPLLPTAVPNVTTLIGATVDVRTEADRQEDAKATMVKAIEAAAMAGGADLAALVDTASFVRAVATISPADSAGLREAVADAVAANPSLLVTPTRSQMQPNRAQGGSASGIATLTPSTAAGRIAAGTQRHADNPYMGPTVL